MTNTPRIPLILSCIGLWLNLCALGHAYTLDEYCNAIYRAEGGYGATYLYGIRSVKYKDETEAREICKRTVYNTLVKYRATRCQEGQSDIDCLSNRYCPIGSDTDNGTCKYWKKNVLSFLNKE